MKERIFAIACGTPALAMLLLLTAVTTQAGPARAGGASITTSAARPTVHSTAGPLNKNRLQRSYLKLPLSFEANQGQADARAKFISRGSGYTLFLTNREAVISLTKTGHSPSARPNSNLPGLRGNSAPTTRSLEFLSMQIVGAKTSAEAAGLDELPGTNNYYIGDDPAKWHINVPSYAKVQYKDVYPGIDLVYYGNQTQLEYDFVVSPGADTKAIKLALSGTSNNASTAGTSLRLDGRGDLLAGGGDGKVRILKPVVYQPAANGKRTLVEGSYALSHGEVTFELAKFDRSKPLIIDPVISYSTFLGGSVGNGGVGIAVDGSDDLLVTGGTSSIDFPTVNALQGTPGGGSLGFEGDAFVSKISADGSRLVYSTYLGGSNDDEATGIGTDGAGNAYVAGYTFSTDFPTLNALQKKYGGGDDDGYVAKISPTGALEYSTYLGGGLDDGATGIRVDSAGNTYVTGVTESLDFPFTNNAYQPFHAGINFAGGYIRNSDAFVTKIAPDGSSLVYSTFLGGTNFDCSSFPYNCGDDAAYGIAIDSAGDAYITGITSSPDFPIVNAAQPMNNGGGSGDILGDILVSKLSPDGSQLLYSTYLGGTSAEAATGIAVDASGDAFVTGYVVSADFPTKNALQPTLDPNDPSKIDAFVAKIDTNQAGAASLLFSTYLGGNNPDLAYAIAVDGSGHPFITGTTTATNFPTTSGALQSTLGGAEDVFLTELSADGSQLLYSSYLGGTNSDESSGIAVVGGFRVLFGLTVYLTGSTESPNFPITPNALQPTQAPQAQEAFITKLTFNPGIFVPVVVSPLPIFLTGSGSTTITATSVDGFEGTVEFDVTQEPAGITVSPQQFALTPSPNGSSSQALSIVAGPSVPPGAYTVLVTEEGTSTSIPVTVTVAASTGGTVQVIGQLQSAGCIANSAVGNVLSGELNLAQGFAQSRFPALAVDTYGAMIVEIQALSSRQIAAACTIGGVNFSPAFVLISDVRGLISNLETGANADPIFGYVVNSANLGVIGAKVSVFDSTNHLVASTFTDVTGFYYFALSSLLTPGANYSVVVTGLVPGFRTFSPPSQTLAWTGTAIDLANFTLN